MLNIIMFVAFAMVVCMGAPHVLAVLLRSLLDMLTLALHHLPIVAVLAALLYWLSHQ